jgi:multicomponent Na+:H+ antiporter subunit E
MDLAEGALERAVRFVFYGRDGARIATPSERGDYTEDLDAEPPEQEVSASD